MPVLLEYFINKTINNIVNFEFDYLNFTLHKYL